MQEDLGKLAMRIISITIALAIVVVLVAKGPDGFPFEVWGLVGAVILAVAAFTIGQVE